MRNSFLKPNCTPGYWESIILSFIDYSPIYRYIINAISACPYVAIADSDGFDIVCPICNKIHKK